MTRSRVPVKLATVQFLVGVAPNGTAWGVCCDDPYDKDARDLICDCLHAEVQQGAYEPRWVWVTAEIPDIAELRGHGVELPPRRMRIRRGMGKRTAALIPTLSTLRAEGRSVREICAATGLSRETVVKHAPHRSRSDAMTALWEKRRSAKAKTP